MFFQAGEKQHGIEYVRPSSGWWWGLREEDENEAATSPASVMKLLRPASHVTLLLKLFACLLYLAEPEID
jgi:hypothetical protein